MKLIGGGQAKVDWGKLLGILVPIVMKSLSNISCNEGLLCGSKTKILSINSFAGSLIFSPWGKE